MIKQYYDRRKHYSIHAEYCKHTQQPICIAVLISTGCHEGHVIYSSIKHLDKIRDKTPSRYSPTLTSHLCDQLAINWRRTSSAQKQEIKGKATVLPCESSRRVPYRIATHKYEETRYRELHHQHESCTATKTKRNRKRERSSGVPLLMRKHLELVILFCRTVNTPLSNQIFVNLHLLTNSHIHTETFRR